MNKLLKRFQALIIRLRLIWKLIYRSPRMSNVRMVIKRNVTFIQFHTLWEDLSKLYHQRKMDKVTSVFWLAEQHIFGTMTLHFCVFLMYFCTDVLWCIFVYFDVLWFSDFTKIGKPTRLYYKNRYRNNINILYYGYIRYSWNA